MFQNVTTDYYIDFLHFLQRRKEERIGLTIFVQMVSIMKPQSLSQASRLCPIYVLLVHLLFCELAFFGMVNININKYINNICAYLIFVLNLINRFCFEMRLSLC